jgi:hypothetical protein
MLIPKPTKPEDLYKFFAYGMPLNYTDMGFVNYCISMMRKRGWNVLVTSDRDSVWLEVAYYTNWNRSETWRLEAYKYADCRVR